MKNHEAVRRTDSPRRGTRRGHLRWFLVLGSLLAASGVAPIASPNADAAISAITNVIATDEDGVPIDFIYDNQDLWAYVTSPGGGFVCVQPAPTSDVPIGDLGCRGAGTWGSGLAPFLSALFIPVQPQPLAPGEWVLVGVDAFDNETARSQEFTVASCQGCEALDPFKSEDFINAANNVLSAVKTMCGLLRMYTVLSAVDKGYQVYQTVLASGPGGIVGYGGAVAGGVAVTGGAILSPDVGVLGKTMLGLCTLLNLGTAVPGEQIVIRNWLNDPPDPNFSVVPAPQFVDLSSHGLPPDDTGIGDAGLRGQVLAAAALDSYERYQGAQLAGSSHWMQEQASAMSGQLFGWSYESRRVAAALRSGSALVDPNPIYDPPVADDTTIADARAFTDRVRTTGLTADEITQLHNLGLNDGAINQLVAGWSVDLNDVDPNTDIAIAMRTLADQMDTLAQAVSDYAVVAASVAGRLEANQPPTPPTAAFTVTPASGSAPLPVHFDANGSTDTDGTIQSYAWNFGDGATGSGVAVDHTYASAGTYTAALTVTDDDGGTGSTSKTVSVSAAGGGNTPPDARDDTVSVPRGSVRQLDVLGNDIDADGNQLTIVGWSAPTSGTLTCSSTLSCTYTAPLTTGSDSFMYWAYDGHETDTATVTLTITESRPPDAVDDASVVDTGSTSVLYVLDNDVDGDAGRPTVVSSTATIAGGTVDCSSGFWCTYEAPAAATTDSFTYTIRDSVGETDTATVNVTVENPGSDPGRFECLSYPDFSSTVGLNIGGDAEVVNDALRLTPALTGQTGRVWTTDKVNIAQGFSTDFVFRFTEQGGIGAADGITFAIQNSSADAVGSAGGSLAYQGIDHSLVVEFDTFDNDEGFGDPDNNHIAVHSAGTAPNGPGGPGTTQLGVQSLGNELRMADGRFHHARVAYDPAGPGTLRVFVDDMVTAKLAVSVDIEDLLDLIGSKSWLGFTSATGSGVENHDVFNWRLCSVGVDAVEPNTSPSASFTAIPATGSAPLDVALDASASDDPDGAIVSYDWDFGDGSTGSDMTRNHVFAPGVFDVTLTITDDRGATATTVRRVTALDANVAPTADAKSMTTPEDTPGGVVISGSDADGDPLTFEVVTSPAHGSLTGSGAFRVYSPDSDFSGNDSFTYTVSDGSLTSSPATVGIVVEPVQDPPVAVDDLATASAGSSRDIDVLANDSDADGDSLIAELVSAPNQGTVSQVSDGVFRFTPDRTGSATFTYRVRDTSLQGYYDDATVRIDVGNRAPTATDDTAATDEDVSAIIDVLANDGDPDGDTLTVSVDVPPAHGSATSFGSAIFYLPAAGYSGTDSIVYRVSDGLASATATVSLTVRTVNDAPQVYAGDVSTVIGAPVDFTVTAVDEETSVDQLTFNVGSPAHGAVTGTYPTYTYTPDGTFGGRDSVAVSVSDGVNSTVVTVHIQVHVVITNGTVKLGINPTGDLNTNANIASLGGTGVVGLRYVPTNAEATAPGCLCEGWGVADAITRVSGYANEAAGTNNITPQSMFVSPSQATVTVTVGETFVVTHHYRPSPFTESLYEDEVTVQNVSGDPVDLRYRRVMDWDIEPTPFSEFVTITKGDSPDLAFTSDDGFAPADPLSGPRQILFAGEAVDSGPADHGALFDFNFGQLAAGGTKTFITYYGAAGDEVGAIAALTAVGAEAYSLGQPSTADGPTLGTPNTFIFAFGNVGGTPVFNRAPIASPTIATTASGTPVDIPLPASDADGDALTFTIATPPAHGTAVVDGDGVATYTPAPGYAGPDEFTFSVSDAALTSAPATVTITVTPAISVNHPPVADAKSVSTAEDTAVTVTLSGSDIDSDPLTFAIVSGPAHGVLSGSGAGRTYTPAANYHGPDSFTYKANDGTADSAVVTVSITVMPVNDAPTLDAVSDQTIPEMIAFSQTLSGSDIDGDTPLTYALTSGPPGLSVSATTGAVGWTPTESQGPGVYPVTVTVADPDGVVAARSFTITVSEVNRPPVLDPIDDQTVHPGDSVNLTASAADADLPANILTYGQLVGPVGATINPATGAFGWVASNTPGDYAVTIGVSDDRGGSAETSFVVHVVRADTAMTLGGATVGQYSDRATITATLTSGTTPLVGQSVTISLGTAAQTIVTNGSGVATATFTVPGPVGSLATGATFAGTIAYASSSRAGTFMVGREDATVSYSGDTIGVAGTTLHLVAEFTDSAAVGFAGSNPETGVGATIGDITKARVAFAIYNAASCLTGSPITTLSAFVVDTGTTGDGNGTANVTWSSSTEGTFCIVPTLVGATGSGSNGFYAAPLSEPAGLAVFIDTPGKVTGGGWLQDVGGRDNFGFNASSNRGVVKGNLVFVEHTVYKGTNAVLIVKSNAIDALRTSGFVYPITATLTGKGSVKYVSNVDGTTLFESGNATFTAIVTDTNRDGDAFGIRVLDKTGAVLVDRPTTPLAGGNIVAHLK